MTATAPTITPRKRTPRQFQLFRPKEKTVKSVRRSFDRQNLEAARIVLASAECYGEGLRWWAELVIERLG